MEFLFVITIMILIFIVVYKLSSPKFKGSVGESRVARKLGKLNDEEFKVFNNVLLRTGSGLSQIDHIVISIYGIFVIETKNYSGWIHGSEYSEYWTQSIYKKKTKFRNPIKQNWAHIFALKEVLSDFTEVAYHPVVVFAGSGELKNIHSKTPIIYTHQLLQTLMDKRRAFNLSIEQVINITNRLEDIFIQDKQAIKEHVHQVRDHAYERKQKERSLVCPRCGGKLVIRNGPYGKFYGCLNYPECRYKLSYRAR